MVTWTDEEIAWETETLAECEARLPSLVAVVAKAEAAHERTLVKYAHIDYEDGAR